MNEKGMELAAIELLRVGFKAVLQGDLPIYKTTLVCPLDAEKVLFELTGKLSEEYERECNGWQWDHWAEFSHEGFCYCLSGSGYYGGLKLERAES